ncbi:MAG: PEP-CTERM sorting domain-containing protein [Planctomycetes bacterium]|nr:PEP-CTERM sorting domain-containing protein [Planctomycetota bacterium]
MRLSKVMSWRNRINRKSPLAALTFAGLSLAATASAARADLLAYWNFNTGFNSANVNTANNAWALATPIAANAGSGSGSISLASWTGTTDAFNGDTTNALFGDAAGATLSLESSAGNNSWIDVSLSTTGYENIILTLAGRGTSTGFSTGTWSWSTDGSTFTTLVGTNTATTGSSFSLKTADFSAISGVNNAASLTLRYTLSGATSTSGNNRIDNVQINGTALAAAPTVFTFDADTGTAGAQDGDGVWANGDNHWQAAGAQQTWSNATPDSAIFGSGLGGNGGAGATVTVSSPVTVKDVTFDAASTDNYTITGSQVNLTGNIDDNKTAAINSDIKFGGSNIVDVASGQVLTLGGKFMEDSGGSGAFKVQGAGRVVVTGDSSSTGFSGVITLTNPVTFEVAAGGNTGFAAVNSTSGSNAVYSGDGTYGGGINIFNGTIEGNATIGTDLGGGITLGDAIISGTITPGYAAGDTSGQITAVANMKLFSTTYKWNLTALKDDATGIAGADWDLIKVNGDLYDGASGAGTSAFSLDISLDIDPTMADSFWSSNHSWLIADAATNGATSGKQVNFSTLVGSPTGFSTHLDAGGDIFLDFTAGVVTPSGTGDIAITEFMANPHAGGDSDLEWVELYNYDSTSINLDGWRLKDDDTNNSLLPSFDLAPGEFLILARNKTAFEAAWLAGVANDHVIDLSSLELANGNDELVLVDANGDVVWRLAYNGGIADGFSVYLADTDFAHTNYGTKTGNVINTNGTDPETGTIGYESNATRMDGSGFYSGDPNMLGPDFGSPFALSTAPIAVPEPSTFGLLTIGAMTLIRRRKR